MTQDNADAKLRARAECAGWGGYPELADELESTADTLCEHGAIAIRNLLLATLSRQQSADAATDQKLCSYCGAQYALLGAHYLDRISDALDAAGAPKKSPDGNIGLSIFDRIAALRHPSSDATPKQADEPARPDGLLPDLDHIANFLNALDTEGMTANGVRSAVYSECLEPGCKASLRTRPTQTQPEAQQPSDGLVEELAACEIAPFPHSLSEYYVVLVDEGLRNRILAALKTRASPETVELLREVKDKGLIYWEPNTERGVVAKQKMIARIDALLSNTPGKESSDG